MYYIWIFVFLIFCIQSNSSVQNFLRSYSKFELSVENNELPELLYEITTNYMLDCVPYILYDEFFFETFLHKDSLFKTMEKLKSISIIHGFMDNFNVTRLYSAAGRQFCFHFIIFSIDEELVFSKLDFQLYSKVVFVSTMSKYQISEFLASAAARNIMNLLVVSDPLLRLEEFKMKSGSKDINLYTHKLHVDGIGSSSQIILTSWRNNKLSREINLFPPKLDNGFNGHQLIISVFEQPPFVYKKDVISGISDEGVLWDGIEIRLLRMIAKSLNFGLNIQNILNANESTGADEVISLVHNGKADLGLSGLYITRRHYDEVFFSLSYSQDCAVFITLSSTAIPKYRAILGPFQWEVWICIILIYLAAVIPLSFSEKLSWKHLFKDSAEVGHMFWMVFGTFTNLFSFKGENSWNNSKKNSTCTVIGTYWVFTIIITAAYSSSIISFITIPTYFDVVDNVDDLTEEEFKVGVTDSRDWPTWFNDTSDYKTNKLLKYLDIINSTNLGLLKVQKKEKYAFLGSQHQLSYIVKTNFSSSTKKKAMFHIASQCLAPFMVSYAMKKKSDFLVKINQQIQRLQENGFIEKFKKDLDWEVSRSAKGRLFTINTGGLRSETPEDRQLTLDDMQGMFLLLGVGVIFAVSSLIYECMEGYKCCRRNKIFSVRNTPSIPSIRLTPCEDNNNNNLSYINTLSVAYGRAVSASISMTDYLTKKITNGRRFSH